MKIAQFIPIFLVFLLFTACNKKGEIAIDQAAISFVINEPKVIGFGKINYKSILDKVEYKSIPKIGNLLSKEIDGVGNCIELETPIYYAVTAGNTENDYNFYSFIQVKNQDSLVDRFTKMGFFVEDVNEMKLMKDGDVTVGIQSKLAIVMVKKNIVDNKSEMNNLFNIAKKQPEKGSIIEEFFAKKGDISFTSKLESITNTKSVTDQVNPSKKEAFLDLFKNAYTYSSINFESGKISFVSENYFPKNLQNKLFLDGDNGTSFIQELGGGPIKIGFATNINTLKLEQFLDDYLPTVKRNLIAKNQEAALGLMLLGDNPLTKLFNGKAVIVMGGNPTGMIMGFVPDLNFHVGIGDKSAKPLYEIALADKSAKINYSINDYALKGSSKESISANQVAKYPASAANFGKKGISMFIDVNALQIQEFGFSNGLQTLELVDNIQCNVTNQQSVFVIEFKDKKTNVLKQVRDFYIKDLEQLVSKISL